MGNGRTNQKPRINEQNPTRTSKRNQTSMPKESHVPQLLYLQPCVKETMQLHPPTPFLLPHRALSSCKVMNYTVPKDAQVIVNVLAISRDPTIWEDPLVFKPERFLKSTLDYKGNDFEFLPFGAGWVICSGLPCWLQSKCLWFWLRWSISLIGLFRMKVIPMDWT